MLKPYALLFDWDNTLVDSWKAVQHALNQTLTEYGHPTWTLAEIKVRCVHSAKDLFPAIFQESWQQAYDFFYQHITACHLKHLKPLVYALELLAFVSSQGIPMAIVSNKRTDILQREIDHLGWRSFFKVIVGSGDAPSDKPSPAPILLALDRMNLKPSLHHWYIGDALTDWQSAIASGCQPVALWADPLSLKSKLSFCVPYIKDCHELYRKVSDFL